MKKIIRTTAVVFGLLIAVTICAADASAQTFSGSIGNGTIARGGSARGTVTMRMTGGIHVNSNRPNSEYAIPTTVRATGRGVKVSAVSYPRGKNKKFSFSNDSINVYDGSVSFGFNVTVPANFKGDTVRVNVAVRYQACTDEVCYPPKTHTMTLTARVR